MVVSPRLLLLAALLISSAGCLHRQPIAQTDNVGSKTSFAELQQNKRHSADTKLRGQANSQNDSSDVLQAKWVDKANGGRQQQIIDPFGPEPPPTPDPAAPSPGENQPAQGFAQNPPRALPGDMGAGRSTPTATGGRLGLGPNDSVAERAVLLSQLLEQAQADAKVQRERVAALESQLETLQRTRPDLTIELEQATEELRKSRVQMEALHGEVATLRERLRRLDKQELDTLQEVILLLEQLVRSAPAAKPGR